MNEVRIIAGRWRSRKISFPTTEGLRPTPDRLRETLFNWLMPVLPQARCLDLFAGSGALGFEALSRGAKEVVFVEKSRAVYEALQNSAKQLEATHAKIIQQDAFDYLLTVKDSFDLIFLDPPFHHDFCLKSIALLEQHPCWTPAARLYIESERDLNWPKLPTTWTLSKEKLTQEIHSRLFILDK